MYICLYAYMFVIMWMCFSCRYTAYLYHFASTWRDMRAFVMTLTDNHVWTRHFYPHDCRSLHHEHIFDALICCAMCIDSLLDLIWFDLIWFVWFWFDWCDLWVSFLDPLCTQFFLAFFLYLHRKGQPWWWTWPNWRMMWRTGRRRRWAEPWWFQLVYVPTINQ